MAGTGIESGDGAGFASVGRGGAGVGGGGVGLGRGGEGGGGVGVGGGGATGGGGGISVNVTVIGSSTFSRFGAIGRCVCV